MGLPHKNFYVMFEFSKRSKTPGIIKKKWPALMGIGRDFNAIQDK